MQFSTILSLFALTMLATASPLPQDEEETPDNCAICGILGFCKPDDLACLEFVCNEQECLACPSVRDQWCANYKGPLTS
jgi:hypothetical protein